MPLTSYIIQVILVMTSKKNYVPSKVHQVIDILLNGGWGMFNFTCKRFSLNFIFMPYFVFSFFYFIFTGLDLESSVQYRFFVRAINYAGLKIEAFSNGFTVDLTPPMEGKAWVGAENERQIYQSDPTKVVVR